MYICASPYHMIFFFLYRGKVVTEFHIACLLACVDVVEANRLQQYSSCLSGQGLQHERPQFSDVIVFNPGGCLRVY